MAAKKRSSRRAYRVDTWFTGATGAKGLQLANASPGWTMRGTFAERRLATAHAKMLKRSEHCSTRIVSVSA